MKKHAAVFFVVALSDALGQSGGQRIEPPRLWNDRDLSDWATPLAALNVPPGHYSEHEYYSAPVGEFGRTYPVYFLDANRLGTGRCYGMPNRNRSSHRAPAR